MNNYKTDKMRLQRYLPQLRACAGLSAEALAQKIGTSKQAISYLETHLEKPLTKMQYICIRSVFDEEFYKNQENINLRDCYDLVFSDESFYDENMEIIEYAIHQAVEDTKAQKRINRKEMKKNGKLKNDSIVGATSATHKVGGVAAATFPKYFPVVGIAKGNSSRKPSSLRSTSSISHSTWMTEAFEGQDTDSSKDDEQVMIPEFLKYFID